MTTPITKADLELELKITFAASYTNAYFTELANYAQAELEEATNGRTSFTGSSQYLAKKAQICKAIEWISLFDRDLLKLAISSISENGASITFADKGIKSYMDTFEVLAAKLRLPNTTNYAITQIDYDDLHTGDEGSILY